MGGNSGSSQALVDVHDDFATLPAQDLGHRIGLLIAYLAGQQRGCVIGRQTGITQWRDLDLPRIYPQPSF